MGGPSRPVDDQQNVRRTLYVTVAREELHPVLRMHDFPEATAHSPRREPTTTPLQQLFVLNSPWMEQQADAMWRRLKPIEGDAARIAECYQLFFARLPTTVEEQVALRFLTANAANAAGGADVADPAQREVLWKDYLQAMLGLNEFHFVD